MTVGHVVATMTYSNDEKDQKGQEKANTGNRSNATTRGHLRSDPLQEGLLSTFHNPSCTLDMPQDSGGESDLDVESDEEALPFVFESKASRDSGCASDESGESDGRKCNTDGNGLRTSGPAGVVCSSSDGMVPPARRRLSSVCAVAFRWNISIVDAQELCQNVEAAQTRTKFVKPAHEPVQRACLVAAA